MRLAEGSGSVFLLFLAAALAAAVLGHFVSFYIHIATLLLFLLFFMGVYFFRDPEREIGDGIVSPADGKVRAVEDGEGGVFISVFMNVHDVHVNRAPLDCTVVSVERVKGGYVPAYKKESERNERVITTLDTELGEVVITQIAGTIARRIVPYISAGQELEKGQRIGLIRYGSRVDARFPPGSVKPAVNVGDAVFAGRTTIGRSG